MSGYQVIRATKVRKKKIKTLVTYINVVLRKRNNNNEVDPFGTVDYGTK